MPKAEILPVRRWPCWPGPYSRRLTGLFGRPKTFSPIRRSSLYLELLRFDMIILQLRFPILRSRSADPPGGGRATASPEVRGQLRAGRLAGGAQNVKLCKADALLAWRS